MHQRPLWPSGRLTQDNAAGQPVELHLANYQQLYYGGAAAVRLYRFDLDRGVVDVSTEVPHIGAGGLNELEREELALTAETDRFSFALPPALTPPATREPRPAAQLVIPGTEAYWRFEGSGSLAKGRRIEDASGRGNTLVVAGPSTVPLAFAKDSHPAQPSGSSLRFSGTTDTGAYLLTADTAPINKAVFDRGYTFEAFFKLPEPFTGDSAWSAIISRWVSAKAAGRVIGDVDEPAATLSVSGGPELQWCVYPASLDRSVTNWGHELRTSRWWHVAVVNDGRLTTMFIDGMRRCPQSLHRQQGPGRGEVRRPVGGWRLLVGGPARQDLARDHRRHPHRLSRPRPARVHDRLTVGGPRHARAGPPPHRTQAEVGVPA